jgi:hypothetical protein
MPRKIDKGGICTIGFTAKFIHRTVQTTNIDIFDNFDIIKAIPLPTSFIYH